MSAQVLISFKVRVWYISYELHQLVKLIFLQPANKADILAAADIIPFVPQCFIFVKTSFFFASASASMTSSSSAATAESCRRWRSRSSPWSNSKDRTSSGFTTCPTESSATSVTSWRRTATGRRASFRKRRQLVWPTVTSWNVAERRGRRNVRTEPAKIRSQSYKTFYVCNLRMSVIS